MSFSRGWNDPGGARIHDLFALCNRATHRMFSDLPEAGAGAGAGHSRHVNAHPF